MADVRAFPGIHYNPARVANLSEVISQPYDKITLEMQRRYLEQHQFNFVRLILPGGEDPYTSSARTCEEWLQNGVLVREAEPAFYILEEEFVIDGQRLQRKGFIGAIRVEEFEKGTVLPHEFTHSGPKADRLALLHATKKDYEQIFFLYPDPEGEIDRLLVTEREPDMVATDEYNVVHRLWLVKDKERIRALHQAMQSRVVLIADGHHRYETALNYRQEMEKKGAVSEDAALRFKSAAFFKITDPGLVILPTYRLLKNIAIDKETALSRLQKWFTVQPIPEERAKVELERYKDGHAFVLYWGKNSGYLLNLRDKSAVEQYIPAGKSSDYKELDVAILHALVIEGVFGITPDEVEGRVLYERYWQDTVARVDRGEAQCALFLNPTRPEQVQALAAKKERMPQKSTDFYPKLISGMVFMDIREGAVLR